MWLYSASPIMRVAIVIYVCFFLLTVCAIQTSGFSTVLKRDEVANSYATLPIDLTSDPCVKERCAYTADYGELMACAAAACSTAKRWIDDTHYHKRWIDTTHYSEGRRSVLDTLERCIRMACYGKDGMPMQECAMVCGNRRKRSVPPQPQPQPPPQAGFSSGVEVVRRAHAQSARVGPKQPQPQQKKWVDPLNYGTGDEMKRSGSVSMATTRTGMYPVTAGRIYCRRLCGGGAQPGAAQRACRAACGTSRAFQMSSQT